MTIIVNINLLLFRWIEVADHRGNNIKSLILQLPWWDFKRAMFKGYVVWKKFLKKEGVIA
jgi:hypothetical protein